ncbi:hypothetical protein IPG41_04655 [Candidatus Peregrinibacteria bacterium]|nr:MAG: hypothetical protein IPG41_04655 [Candidatus Peregrinibacteria bacterium]
MQQEARVIQPVLQKDRRACFIASCLAVARALGTNRSGFDEAALVGLAERRDLMTSLGFKTAGHFEETCSFMSTHLGLDLSSYGGTPVETAEGFAGLMHSGKFALVNAPLSTHGASSFHWRAVAGKGPRGFSVADPLRSESSHMSAEHLASWLVGHAFLPTSIATSVYGVEAKK